MISRLFAVILTLFLLFSCSKKSEKSDAYGNFETEEITISAENSGKIIYDSIEEGAILTKGLTVLITDTAQLVFQLERLTLQKKIVSSRTNTINTQLAVIEEQRKSTVREKERVDKLVKDNAATTKQLDDLTSQVSILEKQAANVQATGSSISDEIKSIDVQMDQIKDQIARSYVKSPVNGTVLTTFVHIGEIIVPGKPMFKIADLKTMTLKVFISGSRLAGLKLGQSVQIKVDNTDNSMRTLMGKITHISDKAEFTPKIIQTKEERVNQVYAVKIEVKNDGSLKIGTPGEVMF